MESSGADRRCRVCMEHGGFHDHNQSPQTIDTTARAEDVHR